VADHLEKWGFRDMWKSMSEELKQKDRKDLNHITHWNSELTRGSRLDRVYLNFETDLEIAVATHTHIGADHKAVRWCLKRKENRPKEVAKNTPHRAYAIREVALAVRQAFTTIIPPGRNVIPVGNLLTRWDRAKNLAKKAAWEAWSKIARQRGKER